ncbi:MAG: hypothetical protein ABFC78_10630, partial [Methanoregula sp.]
MDPKSSCLLKGLIGVIFGGLCLVVPGPVLSVFLGIFWILLLLGIVVCIFIAISSPSEEAFFWFLLSAALVIVGVLSMIFTTLMSFVFALAVAVLAFYVGYSGISLALTRSKSKYILVGGVIISSIVLLGIFRYYVPAMSANFIMTVVGTFSFVFGLFAIAMAFHIKDKIVEPVPPHVLILRTCGIPTKITGPDSPAASKDPCTTGQNEQPPKEFSFFGDFFRLCGLCML